MSLRNKPRTIRFILGAGSGSAVLVLGSYCAFRLHFNLSTAAVICLLFVVLTALKFGFWQATSSSFAAVACLAYFFAPPILSFRVADPENWVALASFEIAALIVSRLSNQVQDQTKQALRHSRNTEKLYQLSRSILVLNRREPMGPQVASLIKNNIGLDSVVIFDSSLAELYTAGTCTKADEELARNTYVLNTNHDDEESLKWQRVLRVGLSPIGAIVMSGIDLTPLMVDAIASLVTAAFERTRSFEKESQAEAVRQNEQLRTAVLDSLAHAFKTPLTVILTSTSGLLEMKHLNAVETELVDLIDQHATKLTALTTHLLRMAKLESSEVRLRPEEVSIPQLIDEILHEYAGQLCDHSVYVRIANEDLQILADRRLLTMTITEFIVNAAKYSSAGSSISISVRTEGSRVVISVHNDGSSIDREERERIFERFYRSPATKHRASGSGIGLSVAKKTAEAHHGNVWVSSDKGTGTTFFLSLPALVKEGM